MKTVLKIKLAPTKEQYQALLHTIEQFNAACDYIAKVAFDQKLASKFKLQQIVYKAVRNQFGLSAQATIRAIAKVCEAYSRDKTKLLTFRPHGAIVYDERIISFDGMQSTISMAGKTLLWFLVSTKSNNGTIKKDKLIWY